MRRTPEPLPSTTRRALAACLLVIGAFPVACTTAGEPVAASDTPSEPLPERTLPVWTGDAEEVDLLEVVFRHLIEHNASSGTALGTNDFVFLSLGSAESGQDPPAELLARFAGSVPRVEPVSAAVVTREGVRHGEMEGRGVLLRVERIRRIDADTVDVDGGYFEASRSASGSSYRLRRVGSSWRVVGEALWWIS